MKSYKVLAKFLLWRVKHLKHRKYLLVLSFIVGILSGTAAVLLKNAVHFTHHQLTHRLAEETGSFWYLAFPVVGIFITVLFVKYFIKDNIGHGVSRILYAISKKDSRIKPHNNYSSIVASTFTIGFGGSVGAEAPIVLTGASIGSNIGRWLRMNYRNTTLLIGCGAAGAIAGIFKAPIAGLVFTLEVLMLDLTLASIVPLLIASVSAATVAFFLGGKGVVFSYVIKDPFILQNIPYFILLGIISGLISLYFTRMAMFIESKFEVIKDQWKRLAIGGAVLSLLIILFPPLYGEGYETIKQLLAGDSTKILENSFFYSFKDNFWLLTGFMVLIIVFKVFATSATTGAGGIGGIFAPTLFMGGITGFIVAKIINKLSFVNVSASNFALVGMAGLMAGVMHAPLTAIFLIAEITGGYGLLIPLMITSTIAYLTIMYFEPHSIYTKRLAKRGELITHHKDKAILTLMKLGSVIERDLITVSPEAPLRDLVKAVSKSNRNIFPVVDEDHVLMGIVLLDDIRHIMFKPEKYDEVQVNDLMILPPSYVSTDENMESVMRKFEETSAWNLPVIDNNKYVGFISKSKIFNAYRDLLQKSFSD